MLKAPLESLSPFQVLWKKFTINRYRNPEKEESLDSFQKIIERLNEIGKNITTKYRVDSIVKTVYHNINQFMDAPVFAIGVYNEYLKGLDFWGLKDGNASMQLGFESLEEYKCWPIHCFNEQTDVFVNDASVSLKYRFSHVRYTMNEESSRSFIFLPLTFKNKRKGVISVQSFKKNSYNNLHLTILRNLASYIAIALENADNYHELQLQKEIVLAKTEQLSEINSLLEKKVSERTQEIEQQSLRLKEYNKKLEMLSIVATQTNNAIMIMDADGNILWLNDCFTRLYGYTYEQFIAARGSNIRQTSFNKDIENTLKRCLSRRKPVFYEAVNVMQTGEDIWTETILTPIYNEKDELTNLVTIDSDITRHKNYETHIKKLEEAERKISQANAILEDTQTELLKQKEELLLVNQTLQDSNKKIQFQNEYIQGGIRYAKTIQEAILPLPERLDKYIDWSVIYLPKDTVSGDFYWFARRSREEFILATIDCTGHGVSGAFMSMVAERLLNEVVKINGVYDPAQILEDLDVGLKKALKQDKNLNNDGFDISLCYFKRLCSQKTRLVFAGAKSKLFYYQQSVGEVCTLKGDSKHIGGQSVSRAEISFQNQELLLDKGDTVIMFTDGLVDQNNLSRKRFGSKKMVETLQAHIGLSTEELKDQLHAEFERHREGCEQRDDITVFFARV